MSSSDPFEPASLADRLSDLSNLPSVDDHLRSDSWDLDDLGDETHSGTDQFLADGGDLSESQDLDRVDVDDPSDWPNDDDVQPVTADSYLERRLADWGLGEAEDLAGSVTEEDSHPVVLLMSGLTSESFDHPLEPADDNWNFRQVAATFERSGLEAAIVHDDLETLADRIDAGATAIIAVETATGTVPMRIVEIRWDEGDALLEGLDGTFSAAIDLDLLEDTWGETANQALISPPPHGEDDTGARRGDWVALAARFDLGDVSPIESGRST